MDVKQFEFPVRFLVSAGKVRHIASTDEALYFLEHQWPYPEGQVHVRAAQVCREVLDGNGTDHEARQAFLDALREGQFELVG